MKTHGKILKELLYKENISQAELAEIIDKSRQTVSGYMTKETIPFEVIEKIITHFNLEKNYFEQLDNTEDYVKSEDYKRLEKLTDYQDNLIKSYQSQINRLEEELSEYKTKNNRQTG